MEFVRSLSADHVVDYTREKVTRGEQRYDLILDVIARHSLISHRRILKLSGTYLCIGCIGGPTPLLIEALAFGTLMSKLGKKHTGVLVSLTPFTEEEAGFLADLFTAGTLKPAIDRTYPLDQVAAALRYVEDGHARGKVVITV